jgi:hypothetical protein
MVSADQSTNVCIRCGKVRIFSRKWTEKIDGRGQIVIHEEYVCVDAECQKIVDSKFAEIRLKRQEQEDRKNLKQKAKA